MMRAPEKKEKKKKTTSRKMDSDHVQELVSIRLIKKKLHDLYSAKIFHVTLFYGRKGFKDKGGLLFGLMVFQQRYVIVQEVFLQKKSGKYEVVFRVRVIFYQGLIYECICVERTHSTLSDK